MTTRIHPAAGHVWLLVPELHEWWWHFDYALDALRTCRFALVDPEIEATLPRVLRDGTALEMATDLANALLRLYDALCNSGGRVLEPAGRREYVRLWPVQVSITTTQTLFRAAHAMDTSADLLDQHVNNWPRWRAAAGDVRHLLTAATADSSSAADDLAQLAAALMPLYESGVDVVLTDAEDAAYQRLAHHVDAILGNGRCRRSRSIFGAMTGDADAADRFESLPLVGRPL